jgi:hypothetical protein
MRLIDALRPVPLRTRSQWRHLGNSRQLRLQKLRALDAPAVIIKYEKRLVFQAWVGTVFPVAAWVIAQVREIRFRIRFRIDNRKLTPVDLGDLAGDEDNSDREALLAVLRGMGH